MRKQRAVLVALLAAALTLGCDKGSPDKPAAQASGKPAKAASAAPVASAAGPWYEGKWSGAYESRHYLVEESKEAKLRDWELDDGGVGTGSGTLKLSIDSDGSISGTASGALGDQSVTGEVDDKSFRLRMTPREPSERAFLGVAVVERDGDVLRGMLQASSGDSLTVRDAPLAIQKGDKPPEVEDPNEQDALDGGDAADASAADGGKPEAAAGGGKSN